MDDAYITSHVNILLPPIFIHKSCSVLKYFFSTAFTLLFFVGPNWLHVRSDLVPGLTYDKLKEKKLFVSLLCLPVGYEMYDTCVAGRKPYHSINPGLLKFNKACLHFKHEQLHKQAS